MTTKYITGTYITAGYTVAPGVSELVVASNAGVGGAGVYSRAFETIFNEGVLDGHPSGDRGFVGLSLYSGGIVTNGSSAYAGATIRGFDGVFAETGAAQVYNFGTIQGVGSFEYTGTGVDLFDTGSVTNGAVLDPKALIEGTNSGVFVFSGATESVINYGSIEGGLGAGVRFNDAGTVRNGAPIDQAALIEGSQGVVMLGLGGGADGVVVNYGLIEGTSGSGVELVGGTVTNGAATSTGATIEGPIAVGVYAAAGTVANFGTITSTSPAQYSPGVRFNQGGLVTNGSPTDRTALIQGMQGVAITGAAGSVVNAGTILGVGPFANYGVELLAGGGVQNGGDRDTSALIQGYGGLSLTGAGAVNEGTIMSVGNDGVGVSLSGFAYVSNGLTTGAVATIAGSTGVMAQQGATVIVSNHGLIEGDGGVAVLFQSSADLMRLFAGSAFIGQVVGGGGTLDLENGTGTLQLGAGDTLTVSGSMTPATFQQFGTIEISAGAQFTDAGAVTVSLGETLIAAGGLSLGASGEGVANAGVLETTGSGTLTVNGAVTGHGHGVVAGGTLDLASAFTQNVTFAAASTGVLELAQSQAYTGVITGFSKAGKTRLDLLDIGFGAGTKATFSGTATAGVLTVTDGTHTAHINLKGDYIASTFMVSSDGHGGSIVVAPKAKVLSSPLASPLHPLIAAMAAFGAPAAVSSRQPDAPITHPPLLAIRHAAMA